MAVMRVTADNRTLTTLVANSIVQGAGPRPGSVRVANAIYSRFPFTNLPQGSQNTVNVMCPTIVPNATFSRVNTSYSSK